ncbi:MAG: hypothetical protein V3T83_02575 [Acidobacteriota bacterium]
MSKIFRYDNCEVIQVPGGFRVREGWTQKVFCVQLEVRFRKRSPGRCSCGNAAAEVAIFRCRHQGAVHALIRQQWLSSLARSGLFRHPERLSLEFEREQRRLLHAFSKAMRAGPPQLGLNQDCPTQIRLQIRMALPPLIPDFHALPENSLVPLRVARLEQFDFFFGPEVLVLALRMYLAEKPGFLLAVYAA